MKEINDNEDVIINESLNYYSKPEMITDLSKYSDFIELLPDEPNVICQVVQDLIVHDMWLADYGLEWIDEHAYSQKIAYMADLLDKALEIDGSNLLIPREPKNRVIACCREFATLMCAMLRAKGIPARARCGFATYFGWSGDYEDHWICEYWNGSRWIMCDPQLDPLQHSSCIKWGLEREENKYRSEQIRHFNPRDLNADDFLTAGRAWLLCREGKADPTKFGIGATIRPEWGVDTLYGLWFIRGQLLRDFGALNKVETSPFLVRICQGLDWKSWHLVAAKDEELSEEEFKLLDEIARLSCDADHNLSLIQKLYTTNEKLTVPAEIIER